MNYTIKLKGGVKNDIPVLSPRELGVCTDTNEVFIGTETGNKDFFKSINEKIGANFTKDNTIRSQMNEKANFEQGNWTPVLKAGTDEAINKYSTQSGQYTKIGNLCYVQFKIALTTKNTSLNGNLYIDGLPFTPTNGYAPSVSFSGLKGFTNLDAIQITGAITLNRINFLTIKNDGTNAGFHSSIIGNDFYVTGCAIYQCN